MSYLINVFSTDHISKYIDDLRMKPPVVIFTIQNYHYETRVSRDSKGRTHTRRVRVNTHYARQNYLFFEWADFTPHSSAVSYIKDNLLTRMTMEKFFNYSPIARQSFNCQMYDFKRFNIRDVHYDFHVIETIEGYNQYISVFKGSQPPWYCNKGYYWLFSLFFMGWLYRMIFVSYSKRCKFEFTKFINK
jgi:hypothetical protein